MRRAALYTVRRAALYTVRRAALYTRAARAARRDACVNQNVLLHVLVLVLISAWNNVNNKKDFEQ